MPDYNGILLIDKPPDFTSFDVVAKLRGIARQKKIGHSGTLDPMATGVLPLLMGRATKAADLLPRQDKCYEARFMVGKTTDTQDITGRVTGESSLRPSFEEVERAAGCFLGDILQTPPMYSAVKQNGKKLYELAREGIVTERKARPVTIHSLEVRPLGPDEYGMRVHCSKGTYIRTLAADIGERLGCGAVLTALRRTMAAGYSIGECVSLPEVQRAADEGRLQALIRPVESAFSALPRAALNGAQARLFLNGVRLDAGRVNLEEGDGPYAVYGPEGFLATARVADGQLRLIRLFAEN